MALTKAHNRMIEGAAVNVKDFGAVGDGVTDDTAAIQAAFTANKGAVYYPEGTYRQGAVTINNSVVVTGSKATIIPAMGLGGGKLFNILTDDVHFSDLIIDATGQTFSPATGNTYIFFSGDGVTTYYNHTFENIKINNCSFTDGNASASNLLVTHAFYVSTVDNVAIRNCYVKTVTGAAVFARDCDGLYVTENLFWDTKWYTFNLASNVRNFDFSNNLVKSDVAEGMYWGGAVNIVSDVGETQVEHGRIANNSFSGKYSYGAVIRLQSALSVTVENNDLFNLTNGTSATSNDLTGVRVSTRGTSSSNKNEPSHDIHILNNYIEGPDTTVVTGDAKGIYVSNDFWATSNPSTNIRIVGNRVRSPSSSNAWSQSIQVHGLTGGIKYVVIEDNVLESLTKSGDSGALALIASGATGTVDYVKVGGNSIRDIGTPSASYQYGLGINAYVDNVVNTKPNTIENFFYGVRTLANSGPTLEKLDDQNFSSNTTDELFAVALSLYGRVLTGSKTYDPPSLAGGASTYATDITVTGATLGNVVGVSFSLDNAGIIFTGYVRVANSVRVYMENKTSGAVDLASGTLKAKVYR